MNPEEFRKMLHEKLTTDGLVTESFEDFSSGYKDNSEKQLQLYNSLVRDGAFKKKINFNEFQNKIFGEGNSVMAPSVTPTPVKKKEASKGIGLGQEIGSENGLSNGGVESPQNTTSQIEESNNSITDNITAIGLTNGRVWEDENSVLLTEMDYDARVDLARNDPSKIYPRELLLAEKKVKEEIESLKNSLSQLNSTAKEGGQKGKDRLLKETLKGHTRILSDIAKDKRGYLLKEEVQNIVDDGLDLMEKVNPLYGMASGVSDYVVSMFSEEPEAVQTTTYAELYNGDVKKYSNYLSVGNYTGEKIELNEAKKKDELYENYKNKIKEKGFDSPASWEKAADKEAGWGRSEKYDPISEVLDDATIYGERRAEFRTYLIARKNAEETKELVSKRVDELAAEMNLKSPKLILGEAIEDKLSVIQNDYKSKVNGVLEGLKEKVSIVDAEYSNERQSFINRAKEEISTFVNGQSQELKKIEAAAGQELQMLQSDLAAKIKGGEITEEDGNAIFAAKRKEIQSNLEEYMSSVNEAIGEKKSALEKTLSLGYQAYSKKRGRITQPTAEMMQNMELLRVEAERKVKSLGGFENLDPDVRQEYQNLYTIALAEIEYKKNTEKDEAWNSYNVFQKFDSSVETGINSTLNAMGLTLSWLSPGFDGAAFATDEFEKKIDASAKKYMKDFEWGDLLDPDFLIANIGEQLPLTVVLGGVGGSITSGVNSLRIGRMATMSPKLRSAIASTTGAITTRTFEASMGAASVAEELMLQGKSYKEAYEAGQRFHRKNMLLAGTDALQSYLWFTNAGSLINTSGRARRSAEWVATKSTAAIGEGAEELLTEVFTNQETNVDYKGLSVLEGIGKLAMTKEGQQLFASSILTGPLMDAAGQYEAGEGLLTMGGNDVSRLNHLFRTYMSDTESMAGVNVDLSITERLEKRDRDLRDTFVLLVARGEMSKSEYKDIVEKLDFQVKKMKQGISGELPFSWESNKFSAYSTWSYEAKSLREAADRLPKSDKAEKVRLTAKAELLEKEIKTILEKPESHTYSIDGTPLTKLEFENIIGEAASSEEGKRNLYGAKIETTDVNLKQAYLKNGLLPLSAEMDAIIGIEQTISKKMEELVPGKKISKKHSDRESAIKEYKEELETEKKELIEVRERHGDLVQVSSTNRLLEIENELFGISAMENREKRLSNSKKKIKKEGEALITNEVDEKITQESITNKKEEIEAALASKKEELEALKVDVLDSSIKDDTSSSEVEKLIKQNELENEIKDLEESSTKIESLDLKEYEKEIPRSERDPAELLNEDIAKLNKRNKVIAKKEFALKEEVASLNEAIPNLVGGEKTQAMVQLKKAEDSLSKLYEERTLLVENRTKLEEERISLSESIGEDITPDGSQDTDEANTPAGDPKGDRKRGYRVLNGRKTIRRPSIVDKVVGKVSKVLFSRTQNQVPIEIDAEYCLIEADDLIPSHRESGQPNQEFFINEGQPRPREMGATKNAAKIKGDNLNTAELGSNYSAYSGAPIVNERGELIQGTGRSQGIKYYYKFNNDGRYQEMIKEEAESLGIPLDKINSMNNPVLVRMVKASDQKAIELGQYKSSDLEDPETPGESERARARTITEQQAENIINELSEVAKGVEGSTTIKKIIRKGAKKLIDTLVRNNLLRSLDVPSLYTNQDLDGNLKDYGVFKLTSLLKGMFFRTADPKLNTVYDSLPYAIREGISQSMIEVMAANPDYDVIGDIHNLIVAINDLESSGETFGSWVAQLDLNGQSPKDFYPAHVLVMTEHLMEGNKGNNFREREVASLLKAYVDKLKPSEGGLFDNPTVVVTNESAAKEVFKNEKTKTANTGRTTSTSNSTNSNAESKGSQSEGRQTTKTGDKKDFRSSRIDNLTNRLGDPINRVVPIPMNDSELQDYVNKNGSPNFLDFKNKLSKSLRSAFGGKFDKLFNKNGVAPRVVFSKSRNPKGVNGFFSRSSGKIKIDKAANMDVIIHELGHWIDVGYDLLVDLPTNLESMLGNYAAFGSKPDRKDLEKLAIKELKVAGKISKDYKKSTATPADLDVINDKLDALVNDYENGEGVAELIGAIMRNPMVVKQNSPELFDYVSTKLGKKLMRNLESLSDDIRAFESLDANGRAAANMERSQSERQALERNKKLNQKIKEKAEDFASRFGFSYDGNTINWGFLSVMTDGISNKMFGVESVWNFMRDNANEGSLSTATAVDKNFQTMQRLLMGVKDKISFIYENGIPTLLKDAEGNVGFSYDGKSKGLGYIFEPLLNVSPLGVRMLVKGKKAQLEMDYESSAKDLAQLMTAERTLEYANKFASDKISIDPEVFEEFVEFLIDNGYDGLASEITDKIEAVSTKKEKTKITKASVFEAAQVLQEENRGIYMNFIQEFSRLEDLTALNQDNLEKSDVESAFEIIDMHEALTDQQKDAFQEASKRYREMANKTLLYQVELGLLSKEKYEEIKAYNSQYVALHRIYERTMGEMTSSDFEGGGSSNPSGLIGASGISSFDRATGGDKARKDPFSALAGVIMNSVKSADKNYVMNSFFDAYRGMGKEGFSGVIEQVKPNTDPSEITGEVFTVWNNGKEERFEVVDKRLAEKLKLVGEFGSESKSIGASVMRGAGIIMKKFQRALTSFPTFPIVDSMRQYQSYNAGVSKSREGFVKDSISKWKKNDLISIEEAQWRYDLYGAGQGGSEHYFGGKGAYNSAMYFAMNELYKKEDGNSRVKKLGRILSNRKMATYEKMMMSLDKQQRITDFRLAYKKYKKLGYSDVAASKEAAIEARDLMDFAVSGSWINAISVFQPFANPAVRGAEKTIGIAKELSGVFAKGNTPAEKATNAGKAWVKIMTWSVLPTILESIFANMGGYEEELNGLYDWQRDLFYNIKVPGYDGWFRIAKGQEIAVFSGITSRLIRENYYGEDIAMSSYPKQLLSGFMPFKSLAGGPAALVGEVVANHSIFRGQPISSDQDGQMTELRWGNKNKSNLAIGSEKIWNKVAPQSVGGGGRADAAYFEYISDNMFGDWSKFAKATTNMIPFFEREAAASTNYFMKASKFYMKNKPTGYKDVGYLLEKAKLYPTLDSNREMKEIRVLMKSYYELGEEDSSLEINKSILSIAKVYAAEIKRRESILTKFLDGSTVVIDGVVFKNKNISGSTRNDVKNKIMRQNNVSLKNENK